MLLTRKAEYIMVVIRQLLVIRYRLNVRCEPHKRSFDIHTTKVRIGTYNNNCLYNTP